MRRGPPFSWGFLALFGLGEALGLSETLLRTPCFSLLRILRLSRWIVFESILSRWILHSISYLTLLATVSIKSRLLGKPR